MSVKSSVSVRLNDDVKKMLDVKRGNQSISDYVTSLIMNDQVESRGKSDVDVESDINNVMSDISDIKSDVRKLLSQFDVSKIGSTLAKQIKLGLIMYGYERDKRLADKSKGDEEHWAKWIQKMSSYPQDEEKIESLIDKLYIKELKKPNPFSKIKKKAPPAEGRS